VITGEGRGFCSGADLSVLAEGADALDGYGSEQDVDTLPTLAWRIGTPVVTAINGPCAGIGVIYALCADRRIAASTATIGAVFSRLGLIAEYGAAWIITRLAGLATAQDLLISGRTIDAPEALRLGLVDEVVDDALGRAMEWARDVADNCSPTAVAVIKGQLADVDSQTLPEAVDLALTHMRASFRRPDFGTAVMARLAKEAPVFPPRQS
jgi:enoyl-CoA hydratase/carnithine racemase